MLTLSPLQVIAAVVIVLALVAVAVAVALAEGRERFRRQLVEQARQDGVQALRFLRRGHDV